MESILSSPWEDHEKWYKLKWCDLVSALDSEYLNLDENWKILYLLENKPSLNLIAFYVQKALSQSSYYKQKIFDDYEWCKNLLLHGVMENTSFQEYITKIYPKNIFNIYFKNNDLKKILADKAKKYIKYTWWSKNLDQIDTIKTTLENIFNESEDDVHQRDLINQQSVVNTWDILHGCPISALDWIINTWLKASILIPDQIMLMGWNMNLWDVSFSRFEKKWDFYTSYKWSVSAKYWAAKPSIDQQLWYTHAYDTKSNIQSLVTVVFDGWTFNSPTHKYGSTEERVDFWIPRRHIKSIIIDWSNLKIVSQVKQKLQKIPFKINLIEVSTGEKII